MGKDYTGEFWSIGRLRGRYQPEDFTETQNLKLKDLITFGAVSRVMFAGWDPREVTLSFMVDSVHRGDTPDQVDTPNSRYLNRGAGTGARQVDCPLNDPEEVWRYIQSIQRPFPRPTIIRPVNVYIPGWGDHGKDEVKNAYITNASIKRTHITPKGTQYHRITGASRAVRAIITVTMKEAVFFTTEDAKKNKVPTF